MPSIVSDRVAWSVGLSPSEPCKTAEASEMPFALRTLVSHLLNIAERFQPNTVLWTFHTIQPSSIVLSWWFIHVAWCTLYLNDYIVCNSTGCIAE